MKKRLITLLLTICTLLACAIPLATPSIAADTKTATARADALKSLGLFQGTDNGYELDRAATRTEAVVMLIRLLGKESEATGSTWKHPFSDVPAWASNYIGYAYTKGITNGVSATKFDATSSANANMYLTFVLRAMNYSDSAGDFQYSSAATFASGIGLVPSGVSTTSFMRGDVAVVSYQALLTKLKGSSTTLGAKLIGEGVFTSTQFEAAKKTAASSGTTTSTTTTIAPTTTPTTSTPSASSIVGNNDAKIDIGNISSGYVKCSYVGSSTAKLKVQVAGPSGTKYNYDLTKGVYETFPLSDGNGSYTVSVLVNSAGSSYVLAYSTNISVTLTSQFAPFLNPNKFVNYTSSSAAVSTASTVVSGASTTLDKVAKIYSYVISNISYDQTKAASITSGTITSYVPNVDTTLSTKKGICFDYASLMCAMTRSQGIPTKLVIGYAGTVYHAWISIYVDGTGWVENVIYFDGTNWRIMDPTFASGGNSSYNTASTTYQASYYY